jgi:N-alpha-acetyl-L-2,4-diaminobutyrate deacetylase
MGGEVQTRESLGKRPTRIVQATEPENYVFAPRSGLLEPVAPFGASVAVGDPIARIYSFDELEREPFVVEATADGLVLASRAIPIVSRGHCVAMIAHEVSSDILFA